MSQNSLHEKPYIGADVSKQTIDFFNSETGEYNTIPNQKASLKRFLKALKDPSIIVFEATGGYERKLSTILDDFPQLTRLRVHPACVKSFARALGNKAKTDKIDAYMLAMAAKTMKDTFYDTTPPQNVQAIRDLFSYQKQLEATLHAEKCRLKMDDLPSILLDEIELHIVFIEKQIAKIKKEIVKLVSEDEKLSAKHKRLQEVVGVGATISLSLIAYLPELGRVKRQQIASLVGLAPHTKQSGTKTGRAFTQGGRKELRKALYMGALVGIRHNEILKGFYERLVKNGRPKMVALIATARKLLIHLNAIEKKSLISE